MTERHECPLCWARVRSLVMKLHIEGFPRHAERCERIGEMLKTFPTWQARAQHLRDEHGWR